MIEPMTTFCFLLQSTEGWLIFFPQILQYLVSRSALVPHWSQYTMSLPFGVCAITILQAWLVSGTGKVAECVTERWAR
jgi:hypothetical protein